MDTDTNERTEVWRLFTEAIRPLQDPQMRINLALAVLATLLDEERIPTEPIVDAIGHAEADVYLAMYPPVGGAA
jgi:hypothetical protein